MKKGAFISIVQNPEKLNGDNIPELSHILREFPYFSTAHTLLAMAYQEEESINFEQQLRKAAAYASDRKRLHELLFLGDKTTAIEIQPEEKTVFQVLEKEKKKENTGEAKDQEETDPLERQILSAAISSSILQEVEKGPLTDKVSETTSESETKVPTQVEKAEEVKQSFDEASSHSFGAWLSHYTDEKVKKETKATLWRNTSELSRNAIEAFSETKKQKQQDFYSAAKMAKLSVKEDDDLVTETLAKIYVAQENYEKGIKAYKKLQLKYPEKKVYFAAQIKALKNNLNS